MKFFDKIKSSKAFKKVAAAICSASVAISALAVNAFAAEGDSASSTVNFSDVSSKILSGFTDVISNCVDIAVAIIPLGLGLFAVGKMWDVAKKFFTKATN